MNNQECRIRPDIINIYSDEPPFYIYSILTSYIHFNLTFLRFILIVNKWNGSCHNINDPCATLFVSDNDKNINIKVYSLMSRTNETRHIKWHETCNCKCRLDASVSNDKKRWNKNKCKCKRI